MHDCTLKDVLSPCLCEYYAAIGPAGYANSLPLQVMHPLAPGRYENNFPFLTMQHLGTCCKLPTRFTQPAHVTRSTRALDSRGAAVISYWEGLVKNPKRVC